MAFLLSSEARRQYGGQICHHVLQSLNKYENTILIQQAFSGVVPRGYILVWVYFVIEPFVHEYIRTDLHTSRSDPKPHYTIDAYGVDGDGNDKPIGCIHVYENSSLFPYNKPRARRKRLVPEVEGWSKLEDIQLTW